MQKNVARVRTAFVRNASNSGRKSVITTRWQIHLVRTWSVIMESAYYQWCVLCARKDTQATPCIDILKTNYTRSGSSVFNATKRSRFPTSNMQRIWGLNAQMSKCHVLLSAIQTFSGLTKSGCSPEEKNLETIWKRIAQTCQWLVPDVIARLLCVLNRNMTVSSHSVPLYFSTQRSSTSSKRLLIGWQLVTHIWQVEWW